MKKVRIGDRWVGEGEPTFVIAEVGSNHDRKLEQAEKMIDIASEAGADAVKFQIFSAESLYSKLDPRFAVVKEFELPQEWIGKLSEHAEKRDIVFLATPFDKEAIDLLFGIGVPAYKWASPEIANSFLLEYAAAKKKPMIISTGMCDLADIQRAVDMVYATGNHDVILLHCSSLYPAKPHQVNLRAMETMRNAFHLPVGLSDHTESLAIPAAAVALGASVIEKHFTLSRTLKGPDHPYSLEPDELKQMVRNIREVEQSMGSAVKKLLAGAENPALNRTGIIAKIDISKGAAISRDMLTVKRSPHGIEPEHMNVVVGRLAKREIRSDEPVSWDMI